MIRAYPEKKMHAKQWYAITVLFFGMMLFLYTPRATAQSPESEERGMTLTEPFEPEYPALARQSSLTQIENSKPGDPSWQLTYAAANGEIEGYASAVSINRGELITFFVSTGSPSYTVEIFRMGWYNSAGARKMAPTVTLAGAKQSIPQPDPQTGLIECRWSASFVLHVPFNAKDPTDWMSGIYLVKLTELSHQMQSYIVFVVRDDSRASGLLFQQSVTTYEAYNDWGGKSLYTHPRAYKVSFNRPYKTGFGAGDFIAYAWDIDMVRFLEREGYDLSYTTNLDTHLRGNLVLRHKAFLSGGHDEYWSWQMRDNVENARNHGVSLGFFGSNASYWQIRFEPSGATGALNRTIVCYKSATLDPITNDGNPSDKHLATTQFRDHPVNRPENAMIGVMFISSHAIGDLVVANASHWVLEGTGLSDGDHLEGLLGNEADGIQKGSPAGLELLAHSPYLFEGRTLFADTTVYQTQSGATVFAAASNRWSWGLDTFAPDHKVYTNAALQQVTRNILARFLNPLPYYLGPGTVSFPPQLVGTTSAAQSVTLVNHTNMILIVKSVSVAGDFGYLGGCEESLAEGQACTLNVVFKPSAVSVWTGSLTVFTNTEDPQSVSLTGTGSNLSVKLSTTHLQFDSQTPGVATPLSGVALTNEGTDFLEISSIVARGNFAESNNCPASLQAGSSCDIFVSFKPPEAGYYSGSLVISDNAPESPQVVSLAGTSQPAPAYGQAKLIYPSPGAKGVPATVRFQWTTVSNTHDSYILDVGTSLGAADAFKGTPTTAGGISVKLIGDRHYFARLWTQTPNGSVFEDIAFDTAK